MPKCKHVFGDKCIKKWFEENDSCPYCRDKLPSELALKKYISLETFRATTSTGRARFSPRYSVSEESSGATGLVSSTTYSYHPPVPDPDRSSAFATAAAQRAHEDYLISRSGENWAYSPPSRVSPADSPEFRRRQARARVSNSRVAHMLGRTTSIGSTSRWANSTNYYLNPSQRSHIPGTPSGGLPSGHNPYLSLLTPGIPTQSNGETASRTNLTPPRYREPLSASPSSSSEDASPPVAVGSGTSIREGQPGRQSEATLHRNRNTFAHRLSEEWGSDPDMFAQTSQELDYYIARSPPPVRPGSNEATTEAPLFEAGQQAVARLHQMGHTHAGENSSHYENSQPRWSR